MVKDTVFGNQVPKKDVRIGTFMYKHYARKNKFNADDWPQLTAVPYKNGYDDFGLMAITEKNTPAQTGSEDRPAIIQGFPNAKQRGLPIDSSNGILLGTMRMGFGHCRMSIALASAARYFGYKPYWFDLLSFPDTAAGKTIQQLENWYNLGSRMSQKSKFFNNKIWEKITSTAAQYLPASLRNAALAEIYASLFHDLPPTMPFLSTHPWVGHGAVKAGMQNIITVIPDNYPLAFHLVEGTLHAVQSPSAFMGYRTLFGMGGKIPIKHCMPSEGIFEAGHFVDHEITSNIDYDCEMRRKRITDGEPRRFLFTMGGAGTQAARFADLVRAAKEAVETNKAAFFINMGDHAGRWASLQSEFEQDGIRWTMHNDWQQTKAFIREAELQKISGVHVFLHDDFYAAVYATNLLMRISDVMITKPSELSFYPVPKLFIHRVGRHEAWGAIRSSECGDGTIETSSITGLHRIFRTLIYSRDLLDLYCSHIIKNGKNGMYDGAYNVVRRAVDKLD